MIAVDAFTDGPHLEDWLELPYRLHRESTIWIPPIREGVRRQVSEANPWFSHGRLRHFLARDGEEVVARATAFVDDHLRADGAPIGLVGFFESEDDAGVAGAVLGAAREWLAAQGATEVLAPVNFSIWFGYRFRTRAHDRPAYSGEPHNPACYPRLFEAHGFASTREYVTSTLDEETRRTMHAKQRPRFEALRSQGYRFRPFDFRHFDDDLRLLHRLLVPAFRAFLGWTDLSFEEFVFEYEGLRHVVDPNLIVFAFDPSGDAVGYLLCLPDVGDALRAMRGRATLLSKLRFAWTRRRVGRVVMADIGIVPEARGAGLGGALNHAIHHTIFANPHYQSVLMGISALDNPSVKFAGDAADRRHYTLYRAGGGGGGVGT